MLGLTELHRRRDQHFGNGRAVRNLFEHAIRRMANRIADIRELSAEQLMLLEDGRHRVQGSADGTELDPSDDGPWRFRVVCPECELREQIARVVPGPESPLPEVPARFRRRLGRTGREGRGHLVE